MKDCCCWYVWLVVVAGCVSLSQVLVQLTFIRLTKLSQSHLLLQISMAIPADLFYATIYSAELRNYTSKQVILTNLVREFVYIQIIAVFEWDAPQ